MNNLNIIDILADDENAAIELALDPESRAKLREIRAYIEHDEELVGMDIHEFENLSADEISRLAGRHLDPDLAAQRSAEIAKQNGHPDWHTPPWAALALPMVAIFCAVGVIFFVSHMPSNMLGDSAVSVASSETNGTVLDRVSPELSEVGSSSALNPIEFDSAVLEPSPIVPNQVLGSPLPSFLDDLSALRIVLNEQTDQKSEDFATQALLEAFGIQNIAAVDMSVADTGWVASLNDLEWRTTLFSFEINDELFSPYRAAPAVGLDRNQSHVVTQVLASTNRIDATQLPPGTSIFGMLVSRPNETTYPLVWVELRDEITAVQTCLDGIPELGSFLSGFSDVRACGGLLETSSISAAERFDGTAFLGSSDVITASFAPAIVTVGMCSDESC